MKLGSIIFWIVCSMPCFADTSSFSLEPFGFSLDYQQREKAIADGDTNTLANLHADTPSARAAYFLKTSDSSPSIEMPPSFYLFFEECQQVRFCTYFKSELAKQLTQRFSVADQISVNKLTDRVILCDLGIIKDCEQEGQETGSIEILPQLVIKLTQWQLSNKKVSGYEVHLALLDYGELLWIESFYQPYQSPRTSLKLLTKQVSDKIVESSE